MRRLGYDRVWRKQRAALPTTLTLTHGSTPGDACPSGEYHRGISHLFFDGSELYGHHSRAQRTCVWRQSGFSATAGGQFFDSLDKTHENWMEANRYIDMDDLREHKKLALRNAA